MTSSDKKVLKAIKYNEEYIKKAEERGEKETYEKAGGFTGFTTLWHIKMELKYYREMLGKDKRRLSMHLRELYQAI